jgi:hypothetical protein
LGLGLRRFSFRVPPFPTGDARILLRFGDEKREEIEVDTPHRFTIVLGNLPLLEPRLPALGRGESARPGEPGVVAWVEGDRSGRGLRYVVGRVEALSLAAVEPGSFFALGFAGPLPPTPVLSLPAAIRASTRSTTKRVSAVLEESGLSGTPVRLLIHRFNE